MDTGRSHAHGRQDQDHLVLKKEDDLDDSCQLYPTPLAKPAKFTETGQSGIRKASTIKEQILSLPVSYLVPASPTVPTGPPPHPVRTRSKPKHAPKTYDAFTTEQLAYLAYRKYRGSGKSHIIDSFYDLFRTNHDENDIGRTITYLKNGHLNANELLEEEAPKYVWWTEETKREKDAIRRARGKLEAKVRSLVNKRRAENAPINGQTWIPGTPYVATQTAMTATRAAPPTPARITTPDCLSSARPAPPCTPGSPQQSRFPSQTPGSTPDSAIELSDSSSDTDHFAYSTGPNPAATPLTARPNTAAMPITPSFSKSIRTAPRSGAPRPEAPRPAAPPSAGFRNDPSTAVMPSRAVAVPVCPTPYNPSPNVIKWSPFPQPPPRPRITMDHSTPIPTPIVTPPGYYMGGPGPQSNHQSTAVPRTQLPHRQPENRTCQGVDHSAAKPSHHVDGCRPGTADRKASAELRTTTMTIPPGYFRRAIGPGARDLSGTK